MNPHEPFLRPRRTAGFSLVEVLVAASLLSLIVLALMAVFSSTQRAFRASVTQADIQDGGRVAMELVASDLRGLVPSYYASNGPVNLMVVANNSLTNYNPLYQSLPGGTVPRTNLLNCVFILGRQNNYWTGTGYIVDNSSQEPLYPLYRYYRITSTIYSPAVLFNDFMARVNNAEWTNLSHVVDGVVHFTVRAYDSNGRWISDQSQPPYTNGVNIQFRSPSTAPAAGYGYGEAQFLMFGATVPAAVDLEVGILEDHALARAAGLLTNIPGPWPNDQRTAYLSRQSGSLHLFRQRVSIPNVDTTVYQ